MKELAIYLVFINVLTFLLYGIDKWKARRGSSSLASRPFSLSKSGSFTISYSVESPTLRPGVAGPEGYHFIEFRILEVWLQ